MVAPGRPTTVRVLGLTPVVEEDPAKDPKLASVEASNKYPSVSPAVTGVQLTVTLVANTYDRELSTLALPSRAEKDGEA